MTEHEDIEKLLRDARLTTTTKLDKRINTNAETALRKSHTMPGPLKVKERILTMKPIKKIAVAAVVVLGVSVVLGLFTRGNVDHGVLFADVVDKMSDVQSLSFDGIERMPGRPDRLYHIDISGARFREAKAGGSIAIADGTQGTIMILYPTRKHAHIKNENRQFGYRRPIDFVLEAIDKLREAKTEDLGSKQLEGQTLVGFRAAVDDPDRGNIQLDIWVNVETRYPVRVDVLYKDLGRSVVLHNIKWNPELDDSLFDMTPPPGYTAGTGQFK